MDLAVLVVVAVVAVLAAAAASGLGRLRSSDGALPPGVRRAATTVTAWRVAGTVVGVGVAAWSLQVDSLGRGLMLAAPLLGLCVLVGVVVGELLVSAPDGPVREAGLTVRRWHAYLPPRLTAVVLGGAALLAGILVPATLAGSPDDMGRAGRSLVRQCSEVMTQSHGPWPGSFYAWPLTVLVGAGLALAATALVRIARRPSQGEDAALEERLRRRSAAAVTAATGLLVAIPLAGVSATAAMALLGIGCRPTSWTALGWGLVAVLAFAVGLAVRSLVVLVAPVSAEPRRTPASLGR